MQAATAQTTHTAQQQRCIAIWAHQTLAQVQLKDTAANNSVHLNLAATRTQRTLRCSATIALGHHAYQKLLHAPVRMYMKEWHNNSSSFISVLQCPDALTITSLAIAHSSGSQGLSGTRKFEIWWCTSSSSSVGAATQPACSHPTQEQQHYSAALHCSRTRLLKQHCAVPWEPQPLIACSQQLPTQASFQTPQHPHRQACQPQQSSKQ